MSWKKDDSLIKSWIKGSHIEEVLYLVSGVSIAKETRRSFEEAFAKDTKDRQRSLITCLHNYKKDSFSILQYGKRFTGICDELVAIQKPVPADDRASWTAIGLGLKYMNFFVDSQLLKLPFPTFSQFVSTNNHELGIVPMKQKILYIIILLLLE